MSAASDALVHDIDTLYRIRLSRRDPWQLANGPAALLVDNPEEIRIPPALIAKAAAHLGWKVDQFDIGRSNGELLDATRRETYQQVIMHDYRTGGPAAVNQTLERELTFLTIHGFRATKQMGMTRLSFRLNAEGHITTEDPAAAEKVFGVLAAAW